MWAVIMLFWKNRDLLMWVLSLLQKGFTAIELRAALAKFDEATEKAHDTKDTSDLDHLFNPGKPK